MLKLLPVMSEAMNDVRAGGVRDQGSKVTQLVAHCRVLNIQRLVKTNGE